MPVTTWSHINEWIMAGRGQGHGDSYKAWLWVRRRNPSPHSNQVVASLPGYRRRGDFFARIEWHVALLCLWLGATDVREQMPMWPFPHPDPLRGALGTKGLPLSTSRGLLHIAKEAGIDHGVYFGTKVPYVATMDLSVTLPERDRPSLAFVALKPRASTLSSEPTDRLLERLELGRRYSKELGKSHHIAHEEFITRDLRGNLEWISSGATLPKALQDDGLLQRFVDVFQRVAEQDAVAHAIGVAGESIKVSHEHSTLLFRHAVWRRLLDVDISRPITLSRPLVPGGHRLREALWTELFGSRE